MKELERAHCAGKVRFPDYRTASQGIRSENARRQKAHPYRCKVCQGWHVGTALGRKAGRPRVLEDEELEA